MNRLIEIIDELKKVRDQTKLNVSDDNLFIVASKYHIGELIQSQKQKPKTYPQKKEEFVQDLASEKQLSLMKKLKLEIPVGLTKLEALRIIQEKMGEKGGRK